MGVWDEPKPDGDEDSNDLDTQHLGAIPSLPPLRERTKRPIGPVVVMVFIVAAVAVIVYSLVEGRVLFAGGAMAGLYRLAKVVVDHYFPP